MHVSAVNVRFFRSFNFDYLRKAHDGYVADPWDVVEPDGSNYPYVCVPLEPSVTTVVGANESGKSQLLSAIKYALGGTGMVPGDFCRYSQFFVIDQAMAYPDLGLEFHDLDEDEQEAIRKACKVEEQLACDRFLMFRVNGRDPSSTCGRQIGGGRTH
jgi:hypothetical protein